MAAKTETAPAVSLNNSKERRRYQAGLSDLLDSETPVSKADLVKYLDVVAEAWKAEALRVKPLIAELESGVNRLADMHTTMLNNIQEERDDCSDLKDLDGRSLKGAK